jgi:hypothetical protein
MATVVKHAETPLRRYADTFPRTPTRFPFRRYVQPANLLTTRLIK